MAVWVWFNPIFASIILISFISLFSYLRKKHKIFYLPKTFIREKWAPKDPIHYLGWIREVLKYDDITLLKTCGLDTIMYLNFLKYSSILFFALSIIGNIILLPINTAVPENPDLDKTFLSGLDRFSLTHVPQGDPIMWFHLISVFINTFLVYFMTFKLYSLWKNTTLTDHALRKQDHFRMRTVFVDGLPKYCKTDDDLKQLFIRMFGQERVVHAIMLPFNIWELYQLQEKRKIVVKYWRRAVDYLNENNIRLTHRIDILDVQNVTIGAGTEVDDLEYYKKQIGEMDEKIMGLQKAYFESQQPISSGSGFVTFDSIATAMMCAQALLHVNRDKLRSQLAPATTDIDWGWFARSPFERVGRLISVIVLLGSLYLFWSIPVSGISTFANLEKLGNFNALRPLVNFIESVDILQGIVQGFLPSIALSAFITILPYILKVILSLRKYLRISQYDRALLRVYWLFLTLNVFLMSILANSYWSIWQTVVEDPEEIFTILATSVPRQALYFANYIIFEGFVGYSVWYFCRIDEFLICKFKQRFTCKTSSEKLGAFKSVGFDFPVQYSRELFIFCIGISYSSMSPLILPFTWCYFTLAYISARYNFIYVFTPPYTGQKMTRLCINRIIAAVIIYHCIMMGLFVLKQFPFGGLILFLVVATAFFRIYLRNLFHLPCKYLALNNCAQKLEDTEEQLGEIQLMYMHPALKPPEPLEQIQEKNELDIEEVELELEREENGVDSYRMTNIQKAMKKPLLSSNHNNPPFVQLEE